MANLASTKHALLLSFLAGLVGASGCDDQDGPLPEDLEMEESLSDFDMEESLSDLDAADAETPELPDGASDFDDGENAVFTSSPLSRKGNTIASADLNADGTSELYTAFYSPVHGAAIYKGTKSSPTQVRIFGPSSNIRVTHMAGGDANDDGTDELYVALEQEISGDFTSALFKMDENGSMTTVLGYSNLGITALADGDGDGAAGNELYSAYVDDQGYGSIYKSQTGNTRGGWIDGAADTTVVALATADFTGVGPEELCIAYQDEDATTIVAGGDRFYNSIGPIWTVTAMDAGDVDADGDEELYIAFRHSNGQSAIYRSDWGQVLNGVEYGPSAYWDVASIQVANLDADATGEIVTGMNHSSGVSAMYLSETGALPGTRIYGFSSVWKL